MTMAGRSEHWYKDPWPWFLMAVPFSAVVMGVVMVVLAVRTPDGLVVDDYYKQGLAINERLDRVERARALGLAARVVFTPDRTGVSVEFEHGAPGAELIVMTLVHPTRAGEDRSVTMMPTAPGRFGGNLEAPIAGRWRIVLEDGGRTWRLATVWRTDEATVTLGANREEKGAK